MLVINKNLTGLRDNIEIDYLDNKWKDINRLLSLENINIIKDIDTNYSYLKNNLNLENNIDWLSMLGKHAIRNNLNEIKLKINLLKEKFNKEYEETLFQRYELTEEILTCQFNESKYEKPVYDHVTSSTGRSKISKGVNFLVMKKEDRNKLTSSFRKGAIFEIDIVSLEPRFFLKYFKNIEVNDVYTHVATSILNNSNSRNKIKLGLLATIYGAGQSTVKKLTGMSSDDYNKIINYFEVQKIKNSLMNEFESKQKIKNAYGRNLYSNTSILNHFIQSSAADCAFRAFHRFYFDNESKFNLIAVIHDAIIIDVPFENISMIENTYCIKEDKLDINLPVTVRRINWDALERIE